MPREPIRHEPGPRDWTPDGWDLEPDISDPLPSHVRIRGGIAGPITALIIGLFAVAVAGFTAPQSDGSSVILLSSVGLLAVLVGVVTWRQTSTHGLMRRTCSAAGIVLGLMALTSTAFTVVNSTWSTNLPTVHEAVRSLVDTSHASPSSTVPLDVVVAQGAVSITSVEDERVYLTEVLTRTNDLISATTAESMLPNLSMSTALYPHLTTDGRVAIGSVDSFAVEYMITPPGGFQLVLTGYAFGTVATYDSQSGTITLQ